jgi:site-specific recombinase XerD
VKRWATDTEAELTRLVATGVAMKKPRIVTFDVALVQYGVEKSSLKKTHQNELVKINTLWTTLPNLDWPIDRITYEHLSGWRDDLIRRGLSDGSILRYFSLLGSIFEWARTEKKWIKINPCKDVNKPKKPPHRERWIIGDEIDSIVLAAKYTVGTVPRNKTQETVLAWLSG